jgi:hypothetical protein
MGERDTRDTSKPATAHEGEFDQAEASPSGDAESVTDTAPDDAETTDGEFGSVPNDTRAQVEQPAVPDDLTIPDDLSIPLRLRRQPEPLPEPRKDGPWAGTYLSDDDIAFIESGKFK